MYISTYLSLVNHQLKSSHIKIKFFLKMLMKIFHFNLHLSKQVHQIIEIYKSLKG